MIQTFVFINKNSDKLKTFVLDGFSAISIDTKSVQHVLHILYQLFFFPIFTNFFNMQLSLCVMKTILTWLSYWQFDRYFLEKKMFPLHSVTLDQQETSTSFSMYLEKQLRHDTIEFDWKIKRWMRCYYLFMHSILSVYFLCRRYIFCFKPTRCKSIKKSISF